MSLKDQITADNQRVFLQTDEFAESATYLPHGGQSREVLVVNTTRPTTRDSLQGIRVNETVITTYASTDSATGIPSPRTNDRLQFDGLTWSYVGINHRDHAGVEIVWRTTTDIRPSR